MLVYYIPETISGLPVVAIGEKAFQCKLGLLGVVIPDSIVEIGDSAFIDCSALGSVTIGKSVSYIGTYAFINCLRLTSMTFEGNLEPGPFDTFTGIGLPAYFLPGTTGWRPFVGTHQMLLWNPTASPKDPDFGVKDGRFGFQIMGTPGITVVVEVSPDFEHISWVPVSTNTLVDGSSYFTDSLSNTRPRGFYRFRTP